MRPARVGPKEGQGGHHPGGSLQTGGSRPGHCPRLVAVGVLILRPQRNGRRGPARKARVCQGFHTLRRPDPRPRWCPPGVCLAPWLVSSIGSGLRGEAGLLISTASPGPSPTHTLKSKHHPSVMAPDRTTPQERAKPEGPRRKPGRSSPGRPSRPPLPAASLPGCSPDAWRPGRPH